jgi:hypothetical protein
VGAPIDVDTSGWLPGMHALDLAAVIPAAAAGTWELRVAMLEDASDLPAYAMLFANDTRVRDDTRRENVLATIMITP